ncbi:MAG: hypothetical protein E5Y29_23280 [Mesorhizobium sp.]|nr:MAG: hypothetical protein E5Y29_23280 [Mesorhizobium sp.]
MAILVAGFTSGALYALATVGLSLVWGSMGMLNMAHAAMLTLGGYVAFTVITSLGLPVAIGFAGAIGAGALAGAILYFAIVRNLLQNDKSTFEANVMIATVGIGIALIQALTQVQEITLTFVPKIVAIMLVVALTGPFIMCVVAGLGNLPGAIAAALGLALLESFVQYALGARWGFPSLLFVVIGVLIWRPSGLFGHAEIRRM